VKHAFHSRPHVIPTLLLAVKVDAPRQTLAFVNATMGCALMLEIKTNFVAAINVEVMVVAIALENQNRALS
jgi:uncharacterized membrane protein YphA (DoxX/SURF4 family)